MSENPIKRYPTIGCCGLDCGICPRYYTVGTSRCPGCCGPDFFNKHPSCSYITCCVKKKSLEVCAQCSEFPCSKFEPWLETGGEYDSFLTHKKAKPNLNFIQKYGLERFLEQQGKRIEWLKRALKDFNDGRSKSFYCIAATLLPTAKLEASLKKTEQRLKTEKTGLGESKIKSRILKEFLIEAAAINEVELRLRKKSEMNAYA